MKKLIATSTGLLLAMPLIAGAMAVQINTSGSGGSINSVTHSSSDSGGQVSSGGTVTTDGSNASAHSETTTSGNGSYHVEVTTDANGVTKTQTWQGTTHPEDRGTPPNTHVSATTSASSTGQEGSASGEVNAVATLDSKSDSALVAFLSSFWKSFRSFFSFFR